MAAEDAPELVRAAQVLERELRRLEELSASVRKIRLHNEKSISRAAREMQEALEQPERLAEGLRDLAMAMAHMQERQQAALDPLKDRAVEIQERAKQVGEYMKRFAALGAQAGETATLLQAASEAGLPDPGDTQGEHPFTAAEARIIEIIAGARSLADDARTHDLPDIAREADSLKQQMQSLRGKLTRAN